MEMIKLRNIDLEKKLQLALDSGVNIWVIGDVHGHFKTFQVLVKKLELNENDVVVMLGDLIDRGPESAQIVHFVRTTRNFYSIRGNHEQMMIEGFDDALFFKERNEDSRIWYHNGGAYTEFSYLVQYGNDTESCEQAKNDVEWMKSLPTEIVLDDWRFVHAGYNPNHDVEGQDEVFHMYVRKIFYSSKFPIDPKRTILFGHTPTFKYLHKDDLKAGKIWESDVKLVDGRSMAIGIDTCVYHDFDFTKSLAAYNIQTQEVIYQNRIKYS
tara:strand:- start:114 stop:917 length:804 start_codon:yes stop_codon:yes gene_type:complete